MSVELQLVTTCYLLKTTSPRSFTGEEESQALTETFQNVSESLSVQVHDPAVSSGQAHSGATADVAVQQSTRNDSTATSALKQPASKILYQPLKSLGSDFEALGRDEELVRQLIGQVEHLTTQSEAKDRQISQLYSSTVSNEQMIRQVEALQHALNTERENKESALADKTRMEEENATLLHDLHQERRKKEEERRQKEAAQRESSDRNNAIVNLRENLSETETLLTNAEAALQQARQKLRDSEKVLRIPANDIRLTDKKLGGGSYGEVCIAYWRGCPVAVKMLYEVLAAVQRNIDLLLQEVAIAWKLHHPNVAAVCGVTLELEGRKKKAWIIMELLQGSMSDVIDDSRRTDVQPLSMREKVDMAHDALCGLDYLHTLSRPVLHGDIRPTNILVTPVMRAKLGDLGAARFTDASLSVGLVSPQYTASERLDDRSAPKSKETDLYSMGVSLCELFTGVPPVRTDREDQLHLIDQRIVRFHCIEMVSDDPRARHSAARVLTGMDRVRQTGEYTRCPPRRMVKGQLDGLAAVTLTEGTW